MLSSGMSHVKFFNFGTFFSGKNIPFTRFFWNLFSSKESILMDLKWLQYFSVVELRERPPLVLLFSGMSRVKFFNFSTFFSGKNVPFTIFWNLFFQQRKYINGFKKTWLQYFSVVELRKRPPLVMLSLGMSHVKFFNFSTFFSGKMFLSHNFLKSFSSKESILLDLKNLATIFWLVSTFLIISNTFLTNHIVGVTWPTFRDFVIVIWAHKGSLQKHGLAVPLKREGY